jgi:hypothetical protein
MTYRDIQVAKYKRYKNITLIVFIIILTNFLTFCITSKVWQDKFITEVSNCEITKKQQVKAIKLLPKIPTKTIFI